MAALSIEAVPRETHTLEGELAAALLGVVGTRGEVQATVVRNPKPPEVGLGRLTGINEGREWNLGQEPLLQDVRRQDGLVEAG